MFTEQQVTLYPSITQVFLFIILLIFKWAQYVLILQ